ncbi:MAG: MBL fold metallo-hydrolase [Chloroflexota bacterium]|nr:MBL fold metallo-hydrolase [Chloroflexota bacterium]
MKLTFLGTRGNIDARTRRHRKHSSMRVSYYQTDVVIDCGEDWRGEVWDWDADAIVVTHAHPDHAFGLKEGAPCPVFATQAAWETMESFDVRQGRTMPVREPIEISVDGESHPLTFEAFPVLHSTRAPAVGYRISAGRVAVFYVPDVAWIEDREAALSGIRVYIGDGASVTRSMVRKPGDVIIGHVPIHTQLTWCQKLNVPRAIFTHLGSEIVDGDEAALGAEIRALAEERDVEQVGIAHDGMEVVLR